MVYNVLERVQTFEMQVMVAQSPGAGIPHIIFY